MSKRKGFTLIELLIVIVVLGILSVVVVPKVMDYPKKARDAVRKQMVSTYAQATNAFLASTENGLTKVTNTSGCINTVVTPPAAAVNLGDYISPYADVNKLDPSGTAKTNTCHVYYMINGTKFAIGMQMDLAADGNATAFAGTTIPTVITTPPTTATSFFVVVGDAI